jgi:hypothetical protein
MDKTIQVESTEAAAAKRQAQEKIAIAAFDHWKTRLELGIVGDDVSDWQWAENRIQPKR